MNEADRRSVLAGITGLAMSAPAIARGNLVGNDKPFPTGFLWGAATAAHQIEGNNVNSDCWFVENVPGTTFIDRSGDAVNSFELWQRDLDLVRDLGLNSYRFSLEWARIEPDAGCFSVAMLDHYKAMIDGCRVRGLHPVVTFNHFTTPRWFAARDGWHNPDAPALFARFCDRAARHLASEIGHATTLNEPNFAGLLGEILPAGLVAADKAVMAEAARRLGVAQFTSGVALYVRDPHLYRANQMSAHRQGVAAIKAVRRDLPVGVSLAMIDDQSAGPDSLRDAMRERYYGEWLRLAAETCDFIGVQNYERKVWGPHGPIPAAADVPRNMQGTEVWPGSLAGAVRYAHAATRLPVLVTEHGINTDDDPLRIWFLRYSLAGLQDVIDDGVPVRGYWHWSLIDNFEWGFGYKPKFGLCTIDRVTFARTTKPSAIAYRAIASKNRVGVFIE